MSVIGIVDVFRRQARTRGTSGTVSSPEPLKSNLNWGSLRSHDFGVDRAELHMCGVLEGMLRLSLSIRL